MNRKNVKSQLCHYGKKGLSFLKEMVSKHGFDAFKFICNCILVNKAIDNGCNVNTNISDDGIDLGITSDD